MSLMVKNDKIKYWLKTADQDWRVANHLFEKEDYSSQEIYDIMANQEKNPEKELAPPTPSEEMGASPEVNTPEREEQEEPSFMPTEKFPAPKEIPQRQTFLLEDLSSPVPIRVHRAQE